MPFQIGGASAKKVNSRFIRKLPQGAVKKR